MKKFFLLILLVTPALHSSWPSSVTAKSQLPAINNASTPTAFKSALRTIYTTYGDPATALQGLKFLETAFEYWQKRFVSVPFYTYSTFLQEQSAAQQNTQPVTPRTAPVVTKSLTPSDFFAQLTQQITQSLDLLQSSLQDPVLSQSITPGQLTTLKASLTTTVSILTKQ